VRMASGKGGCQSAGCGCMCGGGGQEGRGRSQCSWQPSTHSCLHCKRHCRAASESLPKAHLEPHRCAPPRVDDLEADQAAVVGAQREAAGACMMNATSNRTGSRPADLHCVRQPPAQAGGVLQGSRRAHMCAPGGAAARG
jgi:hypothetical protein